MFSFKELLEEPYEDLKSFAESALAEDRGKVRDDTVSLLSIFCVLDFQRGPGIEANAFSPTNICVV